MSPAISSVKMELFQGENREKGCEHGISRGFLVDATNDKAHK